MVKQSLYAIRYVSQRTGLTSHVIRAWEKRYEAVAPQRSPKNRRLYSEDDVQRLQLLKKATAAGHNISQVAQLDAKELLDLDQRSGTVISRTRAIKAIPSQTLATSDHCKTCLSAVLNLDPEALEHSFAQAAVELTRPTLLKEIIAPLFEEIGTLWRKGSLKIV